MIKKRVPLAALQKGLYDSLKTYQSTDVYNKVPTGASLPYIKIGVFNCKPNGSKDTDIVDVTVQLTMFSDYDGTMEINGIIDDVIQVISAVKLDLSLDGFRINDQWYDFCEVFEGDEYGYIGVVTFVAKIQNVKQ